MVLLIAYLLLCLVFVCYVCCVLLDVCGSVVFAAVVVSCLICGVLLSACCVMCRVYC